ncbi:histidine phosphatase family protein [Leptospira perolatii]|uniref:Histidine phosphatase family protein n=1 Tax=Leptospira perolatii TaxID=2023191 RepID=A0A2M9ZJF5_9LEPT|nr:histidine phosphatase family protein [Leptospira perolatii]PJZ68848.1 histidine phosphatase family protein [Leptospira perolatii]PJZ72179.1 histidine phosphatase family protein [Leptospira perolatii]
MSVLYLVRHGQANSRGEVYDLLSPLGKEQSFQLGSYSARNNEVPDRIITGTMRRHIETGQFFMEGVKSVLGEQEKFAKSSFIVQDSRLNEFSPELWSSYAKLISSRSHSFSKTLSQFQRVREAGGIRSAALFFKLTEEILSFWKEGKEVPSGVESFVEFQDRVMNARVEWFSPSVTERNFIFTSGTPISLLLHKILGQNSSQFTWMPWIWNTSLSIFRWIRGEYLPVSINGVPHLLAKEQRTLF